MDPRKYKYIPVIRTRGAELKGFSQLSKPTLKGIMPLVEFTQSRRSSKNPDGAIALSVEKTHDVIGVQPYIADLTSLRNLQNSEIVELLKPDKDFLNWTNFVKNQLPVHCIPTVHLTLPFVEESFCAQAKRLAEGHEFLAIRIPTSYDEYSSVLDSLNKMFGNLNSVIILIDAAFVPPRSIRGATARFIEIVGDCLKFKPVICGTLASSFPSSVVTPGYGQDETGEFVLTEVAISERVKSEFSSKRIIHGDYASIHPLEFNGTVTNWVPRVDLPLDKSLYYYRYRRDDGGYVRAAKEVFRDDRYVDLDCWGCENIEVAAHGEPQGRNPAHWIAVRLNIHISRQVARITT